jgi:hypothetical protein
MKCPHCGSDNSFNLAFCHHCGLTLAKGLKPRTVAMRAENILLVALFIVGVAIVLGILGIELAPLVSNILLHLP